MNPRSTDRRQPDPEPDVERLANLVRDVTGDWRMPPQRLDEMTWRDRISDRRLRSRGRFGRLATPAAAAIVATVGLALGAVWLRTPPAGPGASNTADGSASARPTANGPTASPLPALQVNGDLPSVTSVVVRTGSGYHVADLATGTLGPTLLSRSSEPSILAARPGGGWLCVCATWTGQSANGPTGVRITLRPVAADGSGEAEVELRNLTGRPDPADPLTAIAQLVDTTTTFSDDGRYAFVGWSVRDGAAWTSGMDVIDVDATTVITRLAVPVGRPAGVTTRPWVRAAPTARLSPDGGTILVSSFWYVDDPLAPRPLSGADHWIATFEAGAVGPLGGAGSTPSERCGEFDHGLIDSATYYVLCWSASDRLTVERVASDGTVIDDHEVWQIDAGTESGSLSTRIGDALYVWNPISVTLARIDLATGNVDTTTGSTASAGGDSGDPFAGLAALGRGLGEWLAPSAAAKVFVDPALVASPDGTRLYALGVDFANQRSPGSRGVYAFDAATLGEVGHWPPTADFASITVSSDGRFLYAAASAGSDAAGHVSSNRASITVFDTSNGSVRLIAGDLGGSDIWFVEHTVR